MNNPLENLTPGKNEGDVKIYRNGVGEIIPAKEASIALKVEAEILKSKLLRLTQDERGIRDSMALIELSGDFEGMEQLTNRLKDTQSEIAQTELGLKSITSGGPLN